ncbi:MAG: hypothetical protein IPL46_14990 [Saprospiraceae bacterium]|nr:hypothetical protein [Saprospiraceae bacterium]
MEQKDAGFALANKKNTINLGLWTLTWLVSTALVVFGAKFLWDFKATISIVAILLNLAMGLGMIMAYKRYLMGQDEMQRKIQMDAMALSLGVSVVGGLSYSMLDVVNIVTFDAEISHLVILISITYLLAVIVGTIRYQ